MVTINGKLSNLNVTTKMVAYKHESRSTPVLYTSHRDTDIRTLAWLEETPTPVEYRNPRP